MAPTIQPAYSKDEKALCFHHELLYEAKVLDCRQTDPNDKKSPWQYKVHYKGWKNTWDDWVPQDRLRKLTDENRELAASLRRDLDVQRARTNSKPSLTGTKRKLGGSDLTGSSARGSEERHSSVAATRSLKRGRDYDLEKEEQFHARPSIRILVPEMIKAVLVDDWENVTRTLQLVPLPSKAPVAMILDDYFSQEKDRRGTDNSAELDVLEEIVQGVKEYFNRCLGRLLLYRFERGQFSSIHARLESGTGELAGKTVSDVYGVEHLCRLFVTMPELIAQTNMDQQSVNRLREELSKMAQWLAKNMSRYLVSDYEDAPQDYVQKAKRTG